MFSVQNDVQLEGKMECLVIGLYEQKENELLTMLDAAFSGQLKELLASGDIATRKRAVSKVHTFGKIGAKRLLFIGLGKEKDASFESIKEAFGRVFKEVKSLGYKDVAVHLDSFLCEKMDALDGAHALGEALPLATYEFE